MRLVNTVFACSVEVQTQKFSRHMKFSANVSQGCMAANGTITSFGTCDCPQGWTSAYDALTSGLFCSVAVEFSPNDNSSDDPSGPEPNKTDASPPIEFITFSGVIQLVIVFASCMILVCLFRGLLSKCTTSEEEDPHAVSNDYYRYWSFSLSYRSIYPRF